MAALKLWRPESGVRLNLGCGFDYREGWINADRYADRVDLRFDAFQLPWPLESDSIDWLYANQFFEHIPQRLGDEDGLLAVLDEVGRVLRVGGRCYIGVPYAGTRSDYHNVTHYRHFIETSFDFLTGEASGNTVTVQARSRLRLVERRIQRTVRLGRWFDAHYHLPKYLGFDPNIGSKRGLSFVLERVR